MRSPRLLDLILASSLTACGTTSSSAPRDAALPSVDAAAPAEIRGQRYCEILLATLTGTGAHVDVYTTFGLGDCPQATWSAVDATAVATSAGATKALLNGPRYWTLDRFVVASFADPTPLTLAGLPMRHAASIDVPLADLATLGSAAYTPHSIQRHTTVELDAGKAVYELVGPDGKIYDMQSYSVQTQPQTEADLATLGARLTLPTGWTFRTRTLTAPLQITAVGDVATVVQDDVGNTYQLSQP
jgi:hypothetical protein